MIYGTFARDRRSYENIKTKVKSVISYLTSRSRSMLFDKEFYLQQYPDVASAGVDPLKHFLRHGIRENRKPNAYFDPSYYMSQLSYRVANPIEHYVTVGVKLGLDPHPGFDSAWYLEAYPDVRKSGVNPLLHYLKHGEQEGRRTAPEYRKVFGKSMPAALGYILPDIQNIVLSGNRQFSGASNYHPEIVLPLRLAEHQHAALSTALVLAGRRDMGSVEIRLSTNPHLQPVTICIALKHCQVQFNSESLTIKYQEVAAFKIIHGTVSFLTSAAGSVLYIRP